MKTNKPKSKRAFVSILALFALGFCLALPHWWLRVFAEQISYNGKPSLDSRLYRSRNGEFVLKVTEPKEYAYWITPKNKKVYTASSGNFYFFPFAAFVEHNDQYGVDLEYTAKTGINPQIASGNNFIEFTSLQKRRIRVTW